MEHRQVEVMDLGRIDYSAALEIQKELMTGLLHQKKVNRERPKNEWEAPVHHFLFCEHDPVFTLGRTGKEEHLLLDKGQLEDLEIGFYKTNRGGDITFHGPGQIVGYPIFDLEWFFSDVHKYVRFIEEGVIRTLGSYGLKGKRINGYTGVWLDREDKEPERKICAIGIHLSRWISMHGFALNVNTELNYFNKIIPCGISEGDKGVTSLSKELGTRIDPAEVKEILLRHYADLFQFSYTLLNPLISGEASRNNE